MAPVIKHHVNTLALMLVLAQRRRDQHPGQQIELAFLEWRSRGDCSYSFSSIVQNCWGATAISAVHPLVRKLHRSIHGVRSLGRTKQSALSPKPSMTRLQTPGRNDNSRYCRFKNYRRRQPCISRKFLRMLQGKHHASTAGDQVASCEGGTSSAVYSRLQMDTCRIDA
ncbi:hypothetical protein VTI28DRAFT_5346 [Corynascus sepedonium]